MTELGRKRIAVAVFVKTLNRSPIKTRLAKSIGSPRATEFYGLACNAVREVLEAFQASSRHDVSPYWCVAEDHGHDDWSGFPTIGQGSGDLGDRLHHVYESLGHAHEQVFLLGADSPQISPAVLHRASQLLQREADFTIGPAYDGGFYLFGGCRPVAKSCWQAVAYSSQTTAAELTAQLATIGKVAMLPGLSDVDHVEDFRKLAEDFAQAEAILGQQKLIVAWLKTHRQSF